MAELRKLKIKLKNIINLIGIKSEKIKPLCDNVYLCNINLNIKSFMKDSLYLFFQSMPFFERF